MHDTTSLSALLRDDCGLSTRVNECLYRGFVHCNVNVQHADLAEKFRELLLGRRVVFGNQALSNFLFNLLLRLWVIRVSIHELRHSFLLFPLSVHLSL